MLLRQQPQRCLARWQRCVTTKQSRFYIWASQGEAVFWVLCLWLTLALYVATLPQTFFLFDAAKDWSQALFLNASGRWADRGTNITGLGANGPLLQWLYQFVLRAFPSEYALPVVAASLALAALAAGARLVARYVVPHPLQRARMMAIWATSPLLFEWTRIGVDLAFLAPLIPAVAWSWLRAMLRQRPQDWLLVGVVLALGTQVYVIFVAVALAVIWAAWWAPSRVGESRSGRIVCLLFGAAAVLVPLGPQLRFQISGPLSTVTWDAVTQALWTMLGAYPQHLAVRAAVVAPLLALPLQLLGWLVVAAPLGWLLFYRRTSWPSVLLLTYLAGFAMVAYPDTLRYHHLAHAFVALVAAQIVLGLLLRRHAVATLMVVVLQLAFLTAVQRDAKATGMVALGGLFPFARAETQTYVATLEFRQVLFATLAADGLDNGYLRWLAVEGPWVLPFMEQGWYRFGDRDAQGMPVRISSVFGGMYAGDLTSAVPRWWLGDCSFPRAMPISDRICLSPLGGEVWERRYLVSTAAPIHIPVRTEPRVVRLRYVRPMRSNPAIAKAPELISPQPQDLYIHGSYVTQEQVYTLAPGVTQVTILQPTLLAWMTAGPR